MAKPLEDRVKEILRKYHHKRNNVYKSYSSPRRNRFYKEMEPIEKEAITEIQSLLTQQKKKCEIEMTKHSPSGISEYVIDVLQKAILNAKLEEVK